MTANANRPVAAVSANVPEDLLPLIQKEMDVHTVPVGQRVEQALPREIAERVVGILCTLRTPGDEALFSALPALKVMSNFAVGFDNVDVAAASRAGVLVCNTPGVLDAAVADLTLGLILCTGRKLVQLDAFARDGRWTKGAPQLSNDIAGKTLGLLGMGRIGRMVAQRAQAFGMRIVYHNRNRDLQAEEQGLAQYVERDALFRDSDFVSLHVPLTEQTRLSVGAREFSLMKKSAFLINTARGAVIDEAALIEALKAKTIAGAGLDVFTREPLDPASELTKMDNVVLFPHVASATVETRRAMMELAVHNLVDAVAGVKPRAVVNEQAWPIQRRGNAHG
jgi:lactate dehydrogenase-like 2-hydroxyacid dehydrogenase